MMYVVQLMETMVQFIVILYGESAGVSGSNDFESCWSSTSDGLETPLSAILDTPLRFVEPGFC